MIGVNPEVVTWTKLAIEMSVFNLLEGNEVHSVAQIFMNLVRFWLCVRLGLGFLFFFLCVFYTFTIKWKSGKLFMRAFRT